MAYNLPSSVAHEEGFVTHAGNRPTSPSASGSHHDNENRRSAVIGMLSFASAVLTTVVEQGGFWQYFWLGICILFFVCAMGLVILASKDGIRIDHNGLSFEPRDASSVAERKPGISQEQR
jgi:hypothetical protein